MKKIIIPSYIYTGLFIVCLCFNFPLFLDFFYSLKDCIKDGGNDFLNTYVVVMQDIIFFYALLCLFLKSKKIRYVFYVIPFAVWEVQHAFISSQIHPLVYSSHIYHLFSMHPENISPEYTRIFMFIGIIFIYLIKSFKKRTFHNIFLTLSIMGILGTATLFHVITLKEIDYYSHQQEKQWKKILGESSVEAIQDKCNFLNLECYVYPRSQDPFLLEQPDMVKVYQPYVQNYWNTSPLFYFYTVSNDKHFSDRIFSRKPIAFLKNPDFRIIIIDKVNYTHYLQFSELIFGILAFASHFVWLVGALFLIYFHDKKIRAKALRSKENISKSTIHSDPALKLD